MREWVRQWGSECGSRGEEEECGRRLRACCGPRLLLRLLCTSVMGVSRTRSAPCFCSSPLVICGRGSGRGASARCRCALRHRLRLQAQPQPQCCRLRAGCSPCRRPGTRPPAQARTASSNARQAAAGAVGSTAKACAAPVRKRTSSPRMYTFSSRVISSSSAELSASRTVICAGQAAAGVKRWCLPVGTRRPGRPAAARYALPTTRQAAPEAIRTSADAAAKPRLHTPTWRAAACACGQGQATSGMRPTPHPTSALARTAIASSPELPGAALASVESIVLLAIGCCNRLQSAQTGPAAVARRRQGGTNRLVRPAAQIGSKPLCSAGAAAGRAAGSGQLCSCRPGQV